MDAAPQLLFRQQAEEAFDLATRRTSECNGHASAGAWRTSGFRLAGRVVVHVDIGGNVGVVEELAEFLAAVAAEALADHLAGGDVEGREQRGRAVALVGSPLRLSGTPATVACGPAPGFSRRRSAPAPGGYRPSRTFSTNSGSFDRVSLQWGAEGFPDSGSKAHRPGHGAQGGWCPAAFRVRRITSAMSSSRRGAPGRGSSRRPSRRRSAKRRRHLPTVAAVSPPCWSALPPPQCERREPAPHSGRLSAGPQGSRRDPASEQKRNLSRCRAARRAGPQPERGQDGKLSGFRRSRNPTTLRSARLSSTRWTERPRWRYLSA